MKKAFTPFLLLVLFYPSIAQVQVDHPVQLTGVGTNAKFTGIQNVSTNHDAVSVDYVQRDSLQFAVTTGSSNAYAVNLLPAVTNQYSVGMVVNFRASFANTGAATLNVNGLGADTIMKNYNSYLAANDIQNGQMVAVMFDGTYFQMLSQLGNSSGSVSHEKLTFGYVGANQYFIVPTGVSSVNVKLWGAGGAGGGFYFNFLSGSAGGGGAFVNGTLSVTPGDTLIIIVGQGGVSNAVATYGGGGSGAISLAYQFENGGSGGGRSAIQITSGIDAVTAGGGGGGGYPSYSNNGGGPTYGNGGGGGATTGATGIVGTNSPGSCATTEPGKGATISAPGAGGTNTSCGGANLYAGSSGSQYQGGKGGGGNFGSSAVGGGGGGGYYGGGGGGSYYGSGGGGGSSYPGSGFTISAGSTVAGGSTSTSQAPAGGTSDPDYQTTIGYGGYAVNGGNGLVIISW